MIRPLVVLTLYFVGFHTFGKIFSYLTVNLITAYLLICQPKSIWESLLVFTILIFSGSLQLKPLILIMITCATIVFRAVTYSPHSFNKFQTELPRRASDSCFSVLHNNVRSLRRNLENFQVHLLDELNFDFSVIGVCETKIISGKNLGF